MKKEGCQESTSTLPGDFLSNLLSTLAYLFTGKNGLHVQFFKKMLIISIFADFLKIIAVFAIEKL